jgi:molybdate transport system ATP-binding protein
VVISLKRATFRLGDDFVFVHTDWEFKRGEQWAVLGANGSGKSLFAEALRGGIPLVGGEMSYGFRTSSGASLEQCLVHLSFEDRKQDVRDTVVQSRWNSIEEEATLPVAEYLSYERVLDVNPFEVTRTHLRLRPAFERRRCQAIRLLKLEGFLDRPTISLSSGESQRLQLARALCHPVRLLILDDPFLSLDHATRKHLEAVLRRLSRRIPMLFMSTRPEDVPVWVTHGLLVRDCQVIGAGRKSGVLGTRAVRPLSLRPLAAPVARVPRPDRSPAARATDRRPELVRFERVNIRYGEKQIIEDLSWTVRAGEHWALLGPNGSGKTTLLSLILGDNPQLYANRVFLFGRQRGTGESVWTIKRRIGWVSPELHFYFEGDISCLQVVGSGFEDIVGRPPQLNPLRRMKALRSLRRLGLLRLSDTPYAALSAGLQRMVLLARALVKEPPLLILDEPCQGLDRQHRETFLHALDTLLSRTSVSSVCVAHRPEELPPSITHVLRLRPIMPGV